MITTGILSPLLPHHYFMKKWATGLFRVCLVTLHFTFFGPTVQNYVQTDLAVPLHKKISSTTPILWSTKCSPKPGAGGLLDITHHANHYKRKTFRCFYPVTVDVSYAHATPPRPSLRRHPSAVHVGAEGRSCWSGARAPSRQARGRNRRS